MATAPGKVIRIQKKGPGGLEILVQHDGFVGIHSHLGMAAPAFAEGKGTVAAGEKLGVVGIPVSRPVRICILRWTSLASQSIQHRTWSMYPDAMVGFIKHQMTDRIQEARLSEGGSTI